MINLSVPYLKGKEKKYLKDCINTNYVSTVGKYVGSFEKKFEKILGFSYSCAVNSGTSALHLALKSVGVSKDDLVIMPSYTFAATANSAIYCNAEPLFVDIDKSLNIDLKKLKLFLNKNTIRIKKKIYFKKNKKKIGAIIIVFSLGNIPDLKLLNDIKNKFKIPIICDAAAAHFSQYKNSHLSSFNLDCCYSFNGNKSLTTGAGGIFATNNKYLYEKFFNFANICKNKSGYGYNDIGFNYRMANINAAIGLAQLEKYDLIKKIKKKIYKKYDYGLSKLKNIRKIESENNDFVSWVYAIETRNSKRLLSILNKNKINIKYFWKPLDMQKPYKNYQKINLHNTHKIWKNIITLPSSASLKNIDQQKIIKIIKKLDNEL